MTKKPLSGIAPIKKAAKAPPYKPSPHGEGGPRQRWIGCFRMQHKCASLSPILPSVFHTIVTLSAPAGHLLLAGKAAMRDYHPLKKGGEAASIQQSSLHFGRDDVQKRRIASHSLSHRCVDPSCAFGAPLL